MGKLPRTALFQEIISVMWIFINFACCQLAASTSTMMIWTWEFSQEYVANSILMLLKPLLVSMVKRVIQLPRDMSFAKRTKKPPVLLTTTRWELISKNAKKRERLESKNDGFEHTERY